MFSSKKILYVLIYRVKNERRNERAAEMNKACILILLGSIGLYAHMPQEWGETVSGVKTRLKTDKKVVALTLDLCGSRTDGCDYRYVHFFEQEHIPVTLFVTYKWIKLHPDDFGYLLANPLFALENHGTNHKPSSVNGQSIYGIQGTKNENELIAEVEYQAQCLEKMTLRKPKFYRSGTAYYDEIAVQVINNLGYEVIGFSVLGDAGASWPAAQVKEAILKASAGDIIILHMNRPDKECAFGAIEGLKELKDQGFEFVRLTDYELE